MKKVKQKLQRKVYGLPVLFGPEDAVNFEVNLPYVTHEKKPQSVVFS